MPKKPGSTRAPSVSGLGIARISTDDQDALRLKDQEALYRRWLDDHSDLPYRLEIIAGKGSGECLDREEASGINIDQYHFGKSENPSREPLAVQRSNSPG